MRFDHDSMDGDEPVYVTGNRWYFFLPLPLVGLWILVAVAQLVAGLLAPSSVGARAPERVDLFQDVIATMEWVGGLGWLLLIPFYFVVLSSKRASAWWLLGAFCCGPNLLLYVVLLFLPLQRRWTPSHDPLESLPIGIEKRQRPSTLLLQASFACHYCNALLNQGVSECHECGLRYRYLDGAPTPDDSPYRRGR